MGGWHTTSGQRVVAKDRDTTIEQLIEQLLVSIEHSWLSLFWQCIQDFIYKNSPKVQSQSFSNHHHAPRHPRLFFFAFTNFITKLAPSLTGLLYCLSFNRITESLNLYKTLCKNRKIILLSMCYTPSDLQ